MPEVPAASGWVFAHQSRLSKAVEEAQTAPSLHQHGTVEARACLTMPEPSSPAISFVSAEIPGYSESKQGTRNGRSAEGPAKNRPKPDAFRSTAIQRQRLTASAMVTV